MRKHVAIAVRLTLVTLFVLGLLYPLFITTMAQVVFPGQANGSLIRKDSKVIGSGLIAQPFWSPEYFHPRPSAATKPVRLQEADQPENAWVSGGSNLGPTSKTLSTRVKTDVEKSIQENSSLKRGQVPVDMVTTSSSGLDPDISVANAYAQAARVAEVRGIPEAKVRNLIERNITHRQFGILGEMRVNVLRLNLALDKLQNTR